MDLDNLQILLNQWNIQCSIEKIFTMWNESYRHYHNLTHLNDLVQQINADQLKYCQLEYEKLLITAIFHDCIYDPMEKDNEEKSANFFIECCMDKHHPDILTIKQMILDTKTHVANTSLSTAFNQYDMNIVTRDFPQLLAWEKAIYQEFQVYGDEIYKLGRLKFLASLLEQYPHNTDNLLKLIDWVHANY